MGRDLQLRNLNNAEDLPETTKKGHPIVIGCNYHTTWQSDSRMRFVLAGVEGRKAVLKTRVSKKRFKTNLDDLIFITSHHNITKAKGLRIDLNFDYARFKPTIK